MDLSLPFDNEIHILNASSARHCEWDEWVNGECSKTCGTGTRTNTRVKLVEEANGGNCTGQSFKTKECRTKPCPGSKQSQSHWDYFIFLLKAQILCYFLP